MKLLFGSILFIAIFATLLYGQQKKDYQAFLPDSILTPGAILTTSDSRICRKGYAASVRNVSNEIKRKVFKEYHIISHAPREYEIDHLIPLELGGSNDIKNLWAESYITKPWNAHVKDYLENRLHRLVCTGKISQREAQEKIRIDWIAAYKEFCVQMPLP